MQQFILQQHSQTRFAGRFEILDRLGAGLYGQVYHARDHALLGEEVALKILCSPHIYDQLVLQRFRNEVLLARSLASPYIVPIFEYSQDKSSGLPFIVMEYVRGGTLREILCGSPGGRIEAQGFGPYL